MGRVNFRRLCPPLQAPFLILHGSQEGRARGDWASSVLALPCCRHRGSVDCGGKGAKGPLATRSEEPTIASLAAERVGGGGGLGGACPQWTWRPSAAAACDTEVEFVAAARRGYSGPPRCGEKHRGATPEAQPQAVDIAVGEKRASIGQVWTRHLAPAAPASRPSSPSQFHDCPCHADSALQFVPSLVPGWGKSRAASTGFRALSPSEKRGGGAAPPSRVASCALGGSTSGWVLVGAGPELLAAVGGGQNGSAFRLCKSHTHSPLLVSREVKFGPLRGCEVPRPWGQRGASPQCLRGGRRAPVSRRGARGWEGLGSGARPMEPRGQCRRPSAPVLGHQYLAARRNPRQGRRARKPTTKAPCPSRPTRQQRLRSQPGHLHLGHEGAPCSKQSTS